MYRSFPIISTNTAVAASAADVVVSVAAVASSSEAVVVSVAAVALLRRRSGKTA